MLNFSLSRSVLKSSLNMFSPRDFKKLFLVASSQVLLSFLDLIGVAAVGIVGALSVSGIKSSAPGTRVNSVLKLLHINDWQFQNQVAVIGIVAVCLMVTRTLLSIYFIRKTLRFLSNKSAKLSSDLASKFLNQSLLRIEKKSIQENIYSLSAGVDLITIQVIGTSLTLLADLTLLLVLSAGLIVVDPLMALITIFLFGSTAFGAYFKLHKVAKSLGLESSNLSILSSQKLHFSIDGYREAFVRNRREFFAREIAKTRTELADSTAGLALLPNISKYLIESVVIIATLAISAIQFSTQDATHAVATISIFMAAGSRVAPAFLRIQQGFTLFQSAAGQAGPTLELIETLKNIDNLPPVSDVLNTSYENFEGSINLAGVSVKYPNREALTLKEINLNIDAGSFVAIVGETGSGKSTLVDTILGIITPATGHVLLSNLTPKDAIVRFAGAIAYVPQEVRLINGSIRENLVLGYPMSSISQSRLDEVLESASLRGFISSLTDGIDTPTGDRGTALSGGQKQRLGIARALLTNPKLLILDEATSSLDGTTEDDIYQTIAKLHKQVTVVVVAHRLSSIREADQIVYLAEGEIKAIGDFETIRKTVPEFDSQAKTMGL